MTPARRAFLVNIIATNAAAHGKTWTGPAGEALLQSADAIRELAAALADADSEVDRLRAHVAELEATLANERAAWVDVREDVLQGGWTGGYPIEINDVLGKIDEYMPDRCLSEETP